MIKVYRIDNGMMSEVPVKEAEVPRQAGVLEGILVRRGTSACCYDCGKSVGNKPKIAWHGNKFLVFCAECYQENPARREVRI